MTKDAAYNRGYDAAMKGKPRSSAPKGLPMDVFNAWIEGYNDGLRTKSYRKRMGIKLI